MSGWITEMNGDCEYHLSTTAGGTLERYNVVGHVTLNDAGEWVAFTGDVHQGKVVGSGYPSLYAAKRAVDAAVNDRCEDCGGRFIRGSHMCFGTSTKGK